jgi:hypothetical protein
MLWTKLGNESGPLPSCALINTATSVASPLSPPHLLNGYFTLVMRMAGRALCCTRFCGDVYNGSELCQPCVTCTEMTNDGCLCSMCASGVLGRRGDGGTDSWFRREVDSLISASKEHRLVKFRAIG